MRVLIVFIFLCSGLVLCEQNDLYKKASELIAQKNYEQAYVVLNQLTTKNPKDIKAYELIAHMYRDMGGADNIKIAEAYYYRIFKDDQNNTKIEMELGACSYLLGHREKARMIFEDVKKAGSKMKKLNYYLGALAFDKGHTTLAREYLKKEIDLYGSDAGVLFMLGTTYEYDTEGKRVNNETSMDEAIKYYKEAVNVDPEHINSLMALSIDYSIKKDQDKAIQAAEKILKVKNSDNVKYVVYYNLACFYSIKKDTKNAMDNLKKAMDAGFDDLNHMKEDKDLDNIRNTKEYKQLLSITTR